MSVHPASHMVDILSAHRRRLAHQHQHEGITRYLFQDAETAYRQSHEQVFGYPYGGEDSNKELYRFFRDVVAEVLERQKFLPR